MKRAKRKTLLPLQAAMTAAAATAVGLPEEVRREREESGAAAICAGPCNQPYVSGAVAIRARRCNRMHQAQKSLALQPLLMKGHLLELDQALQPYVLEAATVRVRGCDRAC